MDLVGSDLRSAAALTIAAIIAKRLNIDCINFYELIECDIASQHNINVCAPAVAIAQLNRLSEIK